MSDVTLVIHRADGREDQLQVRSRIDTAIEVEYVQARRHSPVRAATAPGRIGATVLTQLLSAVV
jgi:hypothetical protein